VAAVISCVYCGGAHARPADVRACWATQAQPALALDPEPVAAEPRPAERASAPSGWHGRRGPVDLGRNAVVGEGAAAPAGWEGCERIVIDPAALESTAPVVGAMRSAATEGRALVVELRASFDDPPHEIDRRPQHLLGPGHTFWRDELHYLVWANAVDLRVPDAPRWAALEAALAQGATPAGDQPAGDIVLPTGDTVWLDGGPIRHRDPIEGVGVLHWVQVEHGQLAVPGANHSVAELAPDQRAAVTHAGGSARIIAPAGSGKTRVLTERARHLVTVWRVAPSAVSLVAFNKRAQTEMQARTADLRGLEVRTLNSIALAIVNGVAPFASQPRRWRTIDEPEVRTLLGRFVQTRRQLNVDPLAPWLDALSAVRLGLLAPDEVSARYGGDVDGLADVWPQLRDAMDRGGVVDFDDQIRRAIDVLLTQPDARRAAQRACRVLLVDEFQDLTPAHMLLVRLLSGSGGSVFGVGDDDQTIYGYNGADPAWLIDFARWFPGAGDHPLEVNYRCPAGVVDVADRLLRHNQRRVSKTIKAAAPPSENPGWTIDEREDALAATVDVVSSALADGAQPADVAVLTRVNATIAPVQIALARARIPVAGGVGSEFVERVGIRAALAWLRLATGRSLRGEDLAEASRRPSRGFSPRVREWITEQSSVERLTGLADRLADKDSARVSELAADVGRMRALAETGADTSALLRVLVNEIGLGRAVASLDNNRHGMNRGAQSDDLTALRQIASLHPQPVGFDQWLREALMTPRDSAGVVLSTVHRVKGQEWPQVVVHMAQPDLFPHRLAEDDEEERRLFHVALTRASRQVTIVTGGTPSPFVGELTAEPPADRPVVTTRPAAKPTAAVVDHPLLDRSRVMAVPGLVLVDQGLEWTITELEPAAALAARNGTTRRFALGEKVETAGRQRGALRPRSGDVPEASVRLFDLLRSFRERARHDRPAYTVFDDKTLAAIATALPQNLTELAAVRGVGAVKLEQYGDEVLELAAAVLCSDLESRD
jgi:DNA helicase II / ATP-dependent DNA helicase PcrA